VSDEGWEAFVDRRARYERNLSILKRTSVRSAKGDRVSAAQMLRQPEVRLHDLVARYHVPLHLCTALDASSVETMVKYEGYLRQESSRAARSRREERRRIPSEFPFSRVPGLSTEVIERLSQVRPETIGQASRIPGVTPAAVAVLGAFLSRLPVPAAEHADGGSGTPRS
jgi:tRNA uridine 5-carboxymethylaminomethyl modification enzyme